MSMPMYSFGRTVGCVAISYRIWVDNLLINLYYIILDGTRLTAFTWVLDCLVHSSITESTALTGLPLLNTYPYYEFLSLT